MMEAAESSSVSLQIQILQNSKRQDEIIRQLEGIVVRSGFCQESALKFSSLQNQILLLSEQIIMKYIMIYSILLLIEQTLLKLAAMTSCSEMTTQEV